MTLYLRQALNKRGREETNAKILMVTSLLKLDYKYVETHNIFPLFQQTLQIFLNKSLTKKVQYV